MTQLEQTAKAVSYAMHAIGIDYHKPYTRHGKRFYRPWRNFFNTDINDPVWVWLESQGYAEHYGLYDHETCKTTFYNMTRAGLDWLGKDLDVTIYDEED